MKQDTGDCFYIIILLTNIIILLPYFIIFLPYYIITLFVASYVIIKQLVVLDVQIVFNSFVLRSWGIL